MKTITFRASIAAAFLVAGLSPAAAQSSPGLVRGQVPTAAQWNSYFSSKQDNLGYVPVNKAGDNMVGKLNFQPSNTVTAGANLGQGSDPTTATNGDIWITPSGVFAHVNGSTIGPFISSSSGSPGGSAGQLQYNVGGSFGGFTMSGDCTLSQPAITCTKTNGVNFAASATTDATNASNIGSGTLPSARLPAINLAISGAGGVTGTLPAAQVGQINLAATGAGGVGGNLPVARLNGGTGASSATYWRGDGVWDSPAGAGTVTSATTAAGTGISVGGTCTITASGTCTVTNTGVVALKSQVFSTSGTYTPSANLKYAVIECVGGGGAGAGVVATSGYVLGGAGGGSGSYSRALASSASIGGSLAITIGAAGTGVTGAGGNNGGTTSAGALCIANGGRGADVTSAGLAVGGAGAGGVAGTGNQVAAAGNGGGPSFYSVGGAVYSSTGNGAGSFFGGGGQSMNIATNTNGYPATACGGGGTGGGTNQVNLNVAGGNGFAGCVIITEYTGSP